MSVYFSLSNWSCYSSKVKYHSLPDDLVEITEEEHQKFISAAPSGKRLKRGVYPFVYEDITYTDIQLANTAQAWAKKELEWIDIQLKYNASGDAARTKFTDDVLYTYAIECRNYVQNIDGVLTIMTDKPSRPQ